MARILHSIDSILNRPHPKVLRPMCSKHCHQPRGFQVSSNISIPSTRNPLLYNGGILQVSTTPAANFYLENADLPSNLSVKQVSTSNLNLSNSSPTFTKHQSSEKQATNENAKVEEEIEKKNSDKEEKSTEKKSRTVYTREQIASLEFAFLNRLYLNRYERSVMASHLNLSNIQVKTWFQNRRTKLKNEARNHHPYKVMPLPIIQQNPLPLYRPIYRSNL